MKRILSVVIVAAAAIVASSPARATASENPVCLAAGCSTGSRACADVELSYVCDENAICCFELPTTVRCYESGGET
jgi:hypothetical protein